ncbi:hypothetical protein [Ruegeria sp. HKCCA5426]|nr:hypothetical protein [Ruegeria sp. HKCCA5426]
MSSTLSEQCYLTQSRLRLGAGTPLEPFERYSVEGEQQTIVLTVEVEPRLDNKVVFPRKGNSFSYPSMIAHRLHN